MQTLVNKTSAKVAREKSAHGKTRAGNAPVSARVLPREKTRAKTYAFPSHENTRARNRTRFSRAFYHEKRARKRTRCCHMENARGKRRRFLARFIIKSTREHVFCHENPRVFSRVSIMKTRAKTHAFLSRVFHARVFRVAKIPCEPGQKHTSGKSFLKTRDAETGAHCFYK